jgi:prepilin-type N-terminal cleavage/methylation domain-containing protein
MFNQKTKDMNRGFTLIEILVACTIITTTLLFIMSAATKGIELSSRSLNYVKANYLLEEGAEAVKIVRDQGWSNISEKEIETNYFLTFDNTTNTWNLGTDQTLPLDSIFTRSVVFSNVYRNGDDDISESGTLDENIRKVTVLVSWPAKNEVISKEIIFYLANIFN